MSTERNRKAHARLYCYYFLLAVGLPPHLTSPRQKEPDFLNSFVGYRNRYLTGRKLEMGHAASLNAKKYSDVGAIWCDGISFYR